MTSHDNFLQKFDAREWEQALAELRSSIHEVDRDATEIWFRFYPLALHTLLTDAAADPDRLARLTHRLLLEGNFHLANQIHTSHRFLYGHRFWAESKRAVVKFAESQATQTAHTPLALSNIIREINREVARAAKQDESLTLGTAFVSVMTLRQIGYTAFAAASETIMLDAAHIRKTPAQILRERARDEGQGLFGFLRTEDKRWTVTFDEATADGKFKCINGEELASGAARDTRDWQKVDSRCVEGAIPVQCRAAACGTCWVGVIGGKEKLSPVTRLESMKIKEFGYINSDEERPLIRLACMAQAGGAVSVVVPPWNGIFGKELARTSKDTAPPQQQ